MSIARTVLPPVPVGLSVMEMVSRPAPLRLHAGPGASVGNGNSLDLVVAKPQWAEGLNK